MWCCLEGRLSRLRCSTVSVSGGQAVAGCRGCIAALFQFQVSAFLLLRLLLAGAKALCVFCVLVAGWRIAFRSNNNNNKRPLTPKSMPPAGDEHAKLKT